MAISDNLLPPLDQAALDLGVVFEQLPHPILLLSPDLRIRKINAAGRRFLGKPTEDLIETALFDILPCPNPGTGDWQNLLRASYDKVRELCEPVTLLLSARDGALAGEPTDRGVDMSVVNSRAPAGTGLWHVCHGPIVDANGNLLAIATHALALCGIEAAIAQVGGFAAAKLFTVNRSVDSVVDAPIIASAVGSGRVIERRPAFAARASDGSDAKSAQALSILMVEDNQDLRSSTAELLQFLGHRVVSVPDAELALRQLESGAFDILFTDLTLPKMSGAELARHVLQHHRPTRVVITSGYGRAMANAQNLDAVFLPKPYRVGDLEEVLSKLPVERA